MFDSGGSNKYINFLTSTQLFLKFNLTYNFKVRIFSLAFTLPMAGGTNASPQTVRV